MVKSVNKNLIINIIFITLIVLASISKIFVGIDHDETYVVVTAARLLQGEHLFKEIWDIYQTCILPSAILMKLYKTIFGNLDGVIIFLRIISTIVQFGIAFTFYQVFSNKYKNAIFGAMILALISPRYIQNFCHGFLGFGGILLCILLIEKITLSLTSLDKMKIIIISILSGVALSIGVLSYPTFIILIIPIGIYLVLQGMTEGKFRVALVTLVVTCLFCALLFLVYVLKNVSLDEMLKNLLQNVIADESHSSGNAITSAVRSILNTRKDQIIMGILIVISSAGICFILNKINLKINMFYSIILVSSLAFIMLNVTRIRPSGPFGMNIRWLLIAISSMPIYYRHKEQKDIVWLFGLSGWLMLFAVLMATNLGIAESSSFALIIVLGAILLLSNDDKLNIEIKKVVMYIFIFSLILTRGFTVRINGTSPANILEPRERIEFGVLQGIYDYPDQVKKFNEINRELNEKTTDEDIVFIMSNEPVYNLFGNFKFTSLSPIPTVEYSERWVRYYRDNNYSFPTKVFIDKSHKSDWDDLKTNNLLIKYFLNYMKENSFDESEYLYSFEISK